MVLPPRYTGVTSGAAGVPVVDKASVERVEVRWSDEQRTLGAVAHVELAAERRLTPEGAQTLTEHVQLGAIIGGQGAPPFIDGVEQTS
jgi:hypothetical protein